MPDPDEETPIGDEPQPEGLPVGDPPAGIQAAPQWAAKPNISKVNAVMRRISGRL